MDFSQRRFDESSSFVAFMGEINSFYISHKFLINRIFAERGSTKIFKKFHPNNFRTYNQM